METHRIVISLLLLSLLLSSCGKIETYTQVMRGNYVYNRGEFQDANVLYLKAMENQLFKDVISYNLGNVCFALGESEAALVMWRAARQTAHPGILPNVLYNKGVLRYDLGEYEEAYSLFREVLIMDPTREDARINLEYALKKMSARSNTPQSVQSIPEENTESGDLERILQYVKRKEQPLWKTGESENTYQSDW